MKEDRKPYGPHMITICQEVERLSTILKKSVRYKALLLFICACMLLTLQTCTSCRQDVVEGLEMAGEDWPQWRGLSSNGVSSEADLPTRWSVDSNIVWKVALAGLGGSSPIVMSDQVFVTSQVTRKTQPGHANTGH